MIHSLQVNYYYIFLLLFEAKIVFEREHRCDSSLTRKWYEYLGSWWLPRCKVLTLVLPYYRPRTEFDGRLCFYRCLSVNRWGRGYPGQVPMGGDRGVPQGINPLARSDDGRGKGVPQGTYPPAKVPIPPSQVQWGKGYPKVPTPLARCNGGYPKVPTPQPRYLPPARSDRGVPQGTYPPPAKVPTPPPGQVEQGRGYPKVPTPLGQCTPLASTQEDFLVEILC